MSVATFPPCAQDKSARWREGQRKAADAQRCSTQSDDKSSGKEGGKSPGDAGNLANVVAQKADGGLEHAAHPRGIGQRIGHDLQRRSDGNRQLVGQAEPNQAKSVDGITCGSDLICVLIGYRHAKVSDVLGSLTQGGRIDPAEGQRGLVTKKG